MRSEASLLLDLVCWWEGIKSDPSLQALNEVESVSPWIESFNDGDVSSLIRMFRLWGGG
jgi:hypothetical protein